MPLILPVPAWPYGPKLYHTELQAVQAHLVAIADDIKRNHSSDPLQGMMKHALELAPLLSRQAQLLSGEPQPTICTEGTPPESLEGTRTPPPSGDD